MKLVLVALVIEISLARIFAGSWGWAVVIVLIYCMLVYVRQMLLIKKRNKNKSRMDVGSEHLIIKGRINSNNKSEKHLYSM
ncbi:MAG: hypothetical protein WKG06_40170 [Segetibacter sp.]